MAVTHGKQFEQVVRESFEKLYGVSVDRIPDQTTRYKGSTNICDFMVYQFPTLFYIECKTIHGNTFPLTNIRPNQWTGLLEKSKIQGVVAGVIVWWIDHDVTRFLPIAELAVLGKKGQKSIRYDMKDPFFIDVLGTKKKVYFDYHMKPFLQHFGLSTEVEMGGQDALRR